MILINMIYQEIKFHLKELLNMIMVFQDLLEKEKGIDLIFIPFIHYLILRYLNLKKMIFK